jgi:hypothetical protein
MTSTTTLSTTELTPSYRLALAVMALTLPLGWLQLWVGLVFGSFGLFLLWQTLTLRLRFTPDALRVYRGDTEIRHFPYTQWFYWKIFSTVFTFYRFFLILANCAIVWNTIALPPTPAQKPRALPGKRLQLIAWYIIH